MLDAFDRYVRWLRSGPAVMAMLAFTVTILTVVATRMAELAHEVPTAIRGLGLGYLCAVCVGCAFLHEGGHAIACRNYRVVVESIGIGVCSLMPFAWTRPGQGAWSRLPLRARLVTILAGVFGSLVFAALGGAVWLLAHDVEPLRLVGLFAILSGTLVSAPTLLPIFDGDGYLLLTEVSRRPNLRHRAFRHLAATLADRKRAARISPWQRCFYLGFSLSTIAGRLASAIFVLWLLWKFSLQPAIG